MSDGNSEAKGWRRNRRTVLWTALVLLAAILAVGTALLWTGIAVKDQHDKAAAEEASKRFRAVDPSKWSRSEPPRGTQ